MTEKMGTLPHLRRKNPHENQTGFHVVKKGIAMFELFREKSYLIKWQRSICVPHVVNETVIRAKCEADAN